MPTRGVAFRFCCSGRLPGDCARRQAMQSSRSPGRLEVAAYRVARQPLLTPCKLQGGLQQVALV